MIGRVYSIKHKTLPICYVGSTFKKELKTRWQQHIHSYDKWINENDREDMR